MAMLNEMTPEKLVELVGKNLDDCIRGLLEASIKEKYNAIVKEIATDLLKGIKGHIESYRMLHSGDVLINLYLNGEKINIEGDRR